MIRRSVLVLAASLAVVTAGRCVEGEISQSLERVFLRDLPVLEDDLVENVQNVYKTLNDLNKNEKLKAVPRARRQLRQFLLDTGEALLNPESTIKSVFRDVNEYLQGDPEIEDPEDDEYLKALMDSILCEAGVRLETWRGRKHDLQTVLAMNETQLCSLLRQESEINSSSVGYFFLEIFATVIGLSWGIVSMFL